MIVVEVLLVAAVLFAVAAVAAGRGDVLADEPRDAADVGLPRERPLAAEDLDAVRFPMALRGYRMAEVDEALDRLADELADRDARIAELEASFGPADGTAHTAGEAEPGTPAQPAARTGFRFPVVSSTGPVDDVQDPDPPWRRPRGSRRVPPRDGPSPGQEQPSPGQEQPSPGQEQPSPGQEQPSPGQEH